MLGNSTHGTYGETALRRYSTGADSRSLFGHTMWLVAATAGLFTLGAYLGRDLSGGWALLFYVASFAALIGMNVSVRESEQLTVGLLGCFGLTLGLAVAPTVAYFAGTYPQAVWQAGGATALFVAGCGTFGYSTSRDLSRLGRVLSWALFALIVFGIVLVFVSIPAGSVVYAILGLVVFGGLTMADFQRLRTGAGIDSAPVMAASIFLDVLNIFEFFLMLFGRRSR